MGISIILLLVALLRLGMFAPGRKQELPVQREERLPAQVVNESEEIETVSTKSQAGHRVIYISCKGNSLQLLGENEINSVKLTQIRISPCAQMKDLQLTRKNTREKFLLLSKKNILLTPIFSTGEEIEFFDLEWKDKKSKKEFSTSFEWKQRRT